MRENIGLYKGKRKDTGEWVEGCLVKTKESFFILPEWWNEDLFFNSKRILIEVTPETVCRFSSLISSEEDMIFEGDIVTVFYEDNPTYVFVVGCGIFGGVENDEHFGYPGFAFIPYDEETKKQGNFGLRDDPVYWLNNYKVRITGNIHDA